MVINDLLEIEIKWVPFINSERDFYTISFDIKMCYLRINNFPEEPLWTLFYKGESIDFDDTPKKWDIVYRSEIS